jgi:hypothetical protein
MKEYNTNCERIWKIRVFIYSLHIVAKRLTEPWRALVSTVMNLRALYCTYITGRTSCWSIIAQTNVVALMLAALPLLAVH